MARVSSVKDHETVWSELYPGNRHTVRCLRPAVLAAENALELAPQQRRRTVWRLDGGAGSAEQLRWLLQPGYHTIAKGSSNRRAEALARQVQRWDVYIYSSDGHIVEILSHQPEIKAESRATLQDEFVLPPGQYKSVTAILAKGQIGLLNQTSSLEVTGPSLSLDVQLTRSNFYGGGCCCCN